jgi:hypothetical protein
MVGPHCPEPIAGIAIGLQLAVPSHSVFFRGLFSLFVMGKRLAAIVIDPHT